MEMVNFGFGGDTEYDVWLYIIVWPHSRMATGWNEDGNLCSVSFSLLPNARGSVKLYDKYISCQVTMAHFEILL